MFDGNLVLRNANNNDEIVWEALDSGAQDSNISADNTAFLQSNGNIVIFDKDRVALFTSVQNLLQVCEGNCRGTENCASGLECYDYSGGRRLIVAEVSIFFSM
jgi:hypothetical protein